MDEYQDPSLRGKKILVEADLKFYIYPGEAIRVDILDKNGKPTGEGSLLTYDHEMVSREKHWEVIKKLGWISLVSLATSLITLYTIFKLGLLDQ